MIFTYSICKRIIPYVFVFSFFSQSGVLSGGFSDCPSGVVPLCSAKEPEIFFTRGNVGNNDVRMAANLQNAAIGTGISQKNHRNIPPESLKTNLFDSMFFLLFLTTLVFFFILLFRNVKLKRKIRETRNSLNQYRFMYEKSFHEMIALSKNASRNGKELREDNFSRADSRETMSGSSGQKGNTFHTAPGRRNISQDSLVAKISHEIRTPVNGIIGMCDLALNGSGQNRKTLRRYSDRKQYEYLNIIRNSADSLLKIINDILDYSKIEAGKLELEHIPFSVKQVVDEAADLFRQKINETHLEFVTDVDPCIPEVVYSDPLRLRQVIVNLVGNAFKFTESGEVCVRCDIRQVEHDRITLRFSVRDTGIGIPEDRKNRLFDAYEQADGSISRKFGGTGLGLTICNTIIQLMNGNFWVESEPGKGSRFFFDVEFSVDSEGDTRPAHKMDVFRNKKVLVVEDNASSLGAITRLIEYLGVRVITAVNSKDALGKFQETISEPFDLIIMDSGLPDMDGIRTVRMMESESRGSIPPVLLLISSGDEPMVRNAIRAGIVHHLEKPVGFSRMRNSLHEIFGIERTSEVQEERDSPIYQQFPGKRILVVEDHPVNRKVAGEILDQIGCSTVLVENGKKAVDFLRTDAAFDLILMDVEMPEMDGIEALGIIRNELNLAHIPVIAMTAHAFREDREKCISAGMDDYISKPIQRTLLIKTLAKNLPSLLFGEPNENGAKTGDPNRDEDFSSILNLPEALERLGGSWVLFEDIFEEFRTSLEHFSRDLQVIIENEDIESAKRKVHAIKGAAGNVSAGILLKKAEILEDFLNQGDLREVEKRIFGIEEAVLELNAYYDKIRHAMNSGSENVKKG